MDGADSKLSPTTHDRLTRWYIKNKLGEEPSPKITEDQSNDKILGRYLKIRFWRNGILALFGYIYTSQPFFFS